MNQLPGNTAPEDPATARVVAAAGAMEAWRFALEAHAGQLRKPNQAPYIHHPERVAVLVAEAGADDEMIAAALLHDVLEDTPVGAEQIASLFGDGVSALVADLSDDRSIEGYVERKSALREQVREAGERAALIYAADKLANCTDLYEAYAEFGENVADRLPVSLDLRLEIWRDDADMCAELLGPRELVGALQQRLDDVERARAGNPVA